MYNVHCTDYRERQRHRKDTRKHTCTDILFTFKRKRDTEIIIANVDNLIV